MKLVKLISIVTRLLAIALSSLTTDADYSQTVVANSSYETSAIISNKQSSAAE
jgi:hypothetical protein